MSPDQYYPAPLLRFVRSAAEAGVSRREIATIAARVFCMPDLTIGAIDGIVEGRDIADVSGARSAGARRAAITRAQKAGIEWTPERLAMLVHLWNTGHSARQIAEMMGLASRNTVLGKVWRLGLGRSTYPACRARKASRAVTHA